MKQRKQQSGMAFAATMMVLFIALCVLLLGTFDYVGVGSDGSGLIGMNNDATQIAGSAENTTEAFDLAESGIEYTIEWLHKQPAPPSNAVAFAPAIWNSTSTGNPARSVVTLTFTAPNAKGTGTNTFSGTFSVEVYPDQNNNFNTQKKFLIESIGTFNGVQQMVTAYVQQGSFSKYAYFNDEESAGGYWTCGVDAFDGPMHSNNTDSSGNNPGSVPTNIIWYNNTTTPTPMFQYAGPDAFTCVASTIGWNLDGIGNPTAPSSASDWTNVAVGGSGSVLTNQADVPLPTTSSQQQTSALGTATAPSGTAPSVIVPANSSGTDGGIYIHGAVNNMIFSVTNNTTQNVEIDQTNTTTSPSTTVKTYVTINPTNNSTSIYTVSTQGSSSPVTSSTTTYTGTTNGVVYCDSNIGVQSSNTQYNDQTAAANNGNLSYGTDKTGGVYGTIADNYYNSSGTLVHASGITVATDSSHNTNIDGSVLTNTQRLTSNGALVPESNDPNYLRNAGSFGIVSDAVEVVDNDVNGNALTNVVVDGAVLALDTFDCTNLYRTKGNFQVMGGYIAKAGGYFGLIDGSGNLLYGFQEHYNYDAKLANTPPPFFPTTGNQYDIVSWQRINPSFKLQ